MERTNNFSVGEEGPNPFDCSVVYVWFIFALKVRLVKFRNTFSKSVIHSELPRQQHRSHLGHCFVCVCFLTFYLYHIIFDGVHMYYGAMVPMLLAI